MENFFIYVKPLGSGRDSLVLVGTGVRLGVKAEGRWIPSDLPYTLVFLLGIPLYRRVVN